MLKRSEKFHLGKNGILKDKIYLLLYNCYLKSFPQPFAPPFYILPDIIDSAINISIVSFAINVSMAKLFAKKYKYDIDANQVSKQF